MGAWGARRKAATKLWAHTLSHLSPSPAKPPLPSPPLPDTPPGSPLLDPRRRLAARVGGLMDLADSIRTARLEKDGAGRERAGRRGRQRTPPAPVRPTRPPPAPPGDDDW